MTTSDSRLSESGGMRLIGAAVFFTLALVLPVAFALLLPMNATTVSDSASDERSPKTVSAEATTLRDELDVLPLVVEAPDAQPSVLPAQHRNAAVSDFAGAAETLVLSWNALQYQAESSEPVFGLTRSLVRVSESEPFVWFDDPEWIATADAALSHLATIPGNADNLSNASVALFRMAVSSEYEPEPAIVDGITLYPDALHYQAAYAALLDRLVTHFPDHRAVLLNRAHLESIRPYGERQQDPANLKDWLMEHPDDLTARALLASAYVREFELEGNVDRAVDALAPLLQEPQTLALGHALIGDAHLAQAAFAYAATTWGARREAELAFLAYEDALQLADDADLHAGRAAALDILGQPEEALAELRRAVALAPASPVHRFNEHRLAACTGDVNPSPDGASELPTWGAVRWMAAHDASSSGAPPDDRGFLGYSVGSGLPPFGISWGGALTGGGAYVVGLDLLGGGPCLRSDWPAIAAGFDARFSTTPDSESDLDDDLLGQARSAELAGDLEGAVSLYRSAGAALDLTVLDSERLFGVLVKLGEIELRLGDPGAAMAHLDLALSIYDSTNGAADAFLQEQLVVKHGHHIALNNRGIAQMLLVQGSEGRPDCVSHRSVCRDALADFSDAVEADPFNPVYRMNLAWAKRLLGQLDDAIAALEAAIEADPRLFAAHNDLGVAAALEGDEERAGAGFRRALMENPAYDLAHWNLGVLEMRSGVVGLPGAQAHMARAVQLNPELRGRGLEFIFDDRVYEVSLEAADRLVAPAAQVLGAAAIGLGAISGGASLVMSLRSPATELAQSVGIRHSQIAARRFRLRARLRAVLGGVPVVTKWGPWLVTSVVLAVVLVVSAASTNAAAQWVAAGTALTAALVAIAVHQAGHLFAGGSGLRPTQWLPAVPMSIALLPLSVALGPYPAERFSGASGRFSLWLVYLAGPGASLVAALIVMAIMLVVPAPLLRSLAMAHLAMAAFSLIPQRPLDGYAITRRRPTINALLAFGAAAAAAILTSGTL